MIKKSKARSPKIISIFYTNYRGESAVRKIIPRKIWYGKTKWHTKKQWLLNAYDLDKGADRSFALQDIHVWFQGEINVPC